MSWITLTDLGRQFIEKYSSGETDEHVIKVLNVLNVVGDSEIHGVNVGVDNIAYTLRDSYSKDDILRIIRDLSKNKLISSGDTPLYHKKGEFLTPPPKSVTILDFDESPIGDVKIKKRRVNREQLQEIRDEEGNKAWIEGRRYCPGYEPKWPFSEWGGQCKWYKNKKGCGGYGGIPKQVCKTGEYYELKEYLKDPSMFQKYRFEMPSFEKHQLADEDLKNLIDTGYRFRVVHTRDEEGNPEKVEFFNKESSFPSEIRNKGQIEREVFPEESWDKEK
jgi:hypothetical protein